MSIDAVVFRTFRKLGIDEGDAASFAQEINQAIDKRYELHAKQLFTKSDGAEMESRLTRLISDNQRWTVTTMVAGFAAMVALLKIL